MIFRQLAAPGPEERYPTAVIPEIPAFPEASVAASQAPTTIRRSAAPEKYRRVCFTAQEMTGEPEGNRPSPDKDKPVFHQKVRFYVMQLEIAPTTGQRHWQGYIEFKGPERYAAMKKIFNCQMSISVCKGDRRSNIVYCTKTESAAVHADTGDKEDLEYWPVDIELDAMSNATGQLEEPEDKKSKTYEALYAAIWEGKTETEILKEFPRMYMQHQPAIKSAMKLYSNEHPTPLAPRDSVFVEVLYGGTGTGKSESIERRYANYNKVYKQPGQGKWWIGNGDAQILVLEEFTGPSIMPVEDFLKCTDVNPCFFEEKYGVGVKATWKMVIITSNIAPSEWYRTSATVEQQRAVLSRVSRTIKFINSNPTLDLRGARLENGHPLVHVTERAKPAHARHKKGDLVFPWQTIPTYMAPGTEIVIDIAHLPKYEEAPFDTEMRMVGIEQPQQPAQTQEDALDIIGPWMDAIDLHATN
jgi:hypothetical protein